MKIKLGKRLLSAPRIRISPPRPGRPPGRPPGQGEVVVLRRGTDRSRICFLQEVIIGETRLPSRWLDHPRIFATSPQIPLFEVRLSSLHFICNLILVWLKLALPTHSNHQRGQNTEDPLDRLLSFLLLVTCLLSFLTWEFKCRGTRSCPTWRVGIGVGWVQGIGEGRQGGRHPRGGGGVKAGREDKVEGRRQMGGRRLGGGRGREGWEGGDEARVQIPGGNDHVTL